MKKEVKKYGDTLVITFDAEDQRIYGVKKGDILDLGDIVFDNEEDDKGVEEDDGN